MEVELLLPQRRITNCIVISSIEFLCLYWAINDHFRDYLYNAKDFVVYTDNNPLLYVTSTAKLNACGQRW